MADDRQYGDEDNAALVHKAMRIADFIPEKSAVETSIGTFYVRHARITELADLAQVTEIPARGRAALELLVARGADKRSLDGMSEEDCQALSEADVRALAQAIVKRNGWDEVPSEAGIEGLGEAVQAAAAKEARERRERAESMNRSLERNYGYLAGSTLDLLKEQMAGISLMRERNSAMAAFGGEANFKALSEAKNAMDSFKGAPHLSLNDSVPKALGAEETAASIAKRIAEQRFSDAVKSAQRGIDVEGETMRRNREVPAHKHRELDVGPMHLPRFPLPEETRLGRATVESAENAKETLARMEALVTLVSGLNQTLIESVLPAWKGQIEAGQKDAERAFEQASRSLWWTKWAVIASVLVTVAATCWQVYVARDIDKGNTDQTAELKQILKQQLDAQNELIHQQAIDAAALRQAISSQAASQPSGLPTQAAPRSPSRVAR